MTSDNKFLESKTPLEESLKGLITAQNLLEFRKEKLSRLYLNITKLENKYDVECKKHLENHPLLIKYFNQCLDYCKTQFYDYTLSQWEMIHFKDADNDSTDILNGTDYRFFENVFDVKNYSSHKFALRYLAKLAGFKVPSIDAMLHHTEGDFRIELPTGSNDNYVLCYTCKKINFCYEDKFTSLVEYAKNHEEIDHENDNKYHFPYNLYLARGLCDCLYCTPSVMSS